ncbi:hypothetical protein HG531_007539 [Fusarium graminearum]|nr:hypothetical protein HG531_007539 [Fusarium graminearum]
MRSIALFSSVKINVATALKGSLLKTKVEENQSEARGNSTHVANPAPANVFGQMTCDQRSNIDIQQGKLNNGLGNRLRGPDKKLRPDCVGRVGQVSKPDVSDKTPYRANQV